VGESLDCNSRSGLLKGGPPNLKISGVARRGGKLHSYISPKPYDETHINHARPGRKTRELKGPVELTLFRKDRNRL